MDDTIVKRRRKIIWLLAILLAAAVVATVFWYWQYRQAISSNPSVKQKQLIGEINSVAITPTEQPAITTIIDTKKLTNKSLARQAKNGDQLFIYANAKRIMLYRPSEHKVVDMLTIQTK